MNGARRSLAVNSLLGLLWLNFIILWQIVQRSTGLSDAFDSIGFLGVIALGYSSLVGAWIYHNIQIWREKGPRTQLRHVLHEARQDTLSREITPLVALKKDQDIAVYVRGNQKVFAHGSAGGME